MKLREEITSLGWSVAAFSRLCGGISPHTLKRIEEGSASIKPTTLAKVRIALEKVRAQVGQARAS